MLYFATPKAYKDMHAWCVKRYNEGDPFHLQMFERFWRETKPLPNGSNPTRVYISADGKRMGFR